MSTTNKNAVVELQDLSRKPICTKFHQQQMNGWSPSFDAIFVSRVFIGSSIIYLVIGTIIIIVSLQINDFSFDYTYCQNVMGKTCAEFVKNKSFTNIFFKCECIYPFKIDKELKSPVYFYYVLENFYQNHRQYIKSRDDNQLHGNNIKLLSKNCEPERYADKLNIIAYSPCGLVANSKFNDTFLLHYHSTKLTIPVIWLKDNIAWNLDKTSKFGRPKNWNNTAKPSNWKLSALQNNKKAYSGDEEFLVWMRTAPLYTFKKLHRIIHSGQEPFKNGLPQGNYTLIIQYAYPVTQFNGKKSVYFTTTSIIGGRNVGLPTMFLIMGCIHFILGVFLMYMEKYSDTNIETLQRESIIINI